MYLVINKCVTAVKISNFSGHYLRNRSTLDIGVLGYIVIVQHKEHPPEIWSFPPVTPCICSLCCRFLQSRLENIVSLNKLLILTFVIEVIFGRWIVRGRGLMLLPSNGTKFKILLVYYKQFLGRSCGIRKNCWLDDDYIGQDIRVVCALRSWLVEKSLSRSTVLDELHSLMLSFIYKSFLTH